MPRTTLYAYADDGSYVRSFKNATIAKKVLNVEDVSHIYKAISGKRATAFGYRWAKTRCQNVIALKNKDFLYAVTDIKTKNVILKANDFDELASGLNCKVSQLRAGLRNHEEGLFRQRFQVTKQSKHKL